jgi:hypothetical protein
LDEETAALSKRQQNFQRDRDQMSQEEEDEYEKAVEESRFRWDFLSSCCILETCRLNLKLANNEGISTVLERARLIRTSLTLGMFIAENLNVCIILN